MAKKQATSALGYKVAARERMREEVTEEQRLGGARAVARLEDCYREPLHGMTEAEERVLWRARHDECEEKPCRLCQAAARAAAAKQAVGLDYNTAWWLAQQGYNAKTGALQPVPVAKVAGLPTQAAMTNVAPTLYRAGVALGPVVQARAVDRAPRGRGRAVAAPVTGLAQANMALVMKLMGMK